jgi:AraC family transcriptional regulator
MELSTGASAHAAFASAAPDPLQTPRHEAGHRASGIAAAMAKFVGRPPTCVVNARSSEAPSAAIWPVAGRLRIDALPVCVLSYRSRGTSAVTKIAARSRTYKRPRVGSATFIPAHTATEWLIDEPCSAMHIYLAPEALHAHAAECLDMMSTPRIDDCFAIEDPWLTSYFHLLVSEYETFRSGLVPADGLLLEQTQRILVRHLVRWHAGGATAARAECEERRPVNSLRPFLVRRIQDYVDTNLASDISLTVLAGLASMSPGHFLRSFKAATGLTPYRYVLERRLNRASLLVRASATPIAEIAHACGFRTPNYFTTRFHAHFGISPMRYRDGSRDRD